MRLRSAAIPVAPGAIVATALMALPSFAVAQSPSVDLRGYHASTDAAAGNTLEPASAPETGAWNVGLRVHYAHRPVELVALPGSEIAPIQHQVTSDLVLAVGLWRRLLLGMDLPYVLGQTGDPITDPGLRAALGVAAADAVPVVALGDLGLSGKLVVMPADEAEFGGFGMALLQRFGLPTGDETSWIAEGAATSETRALGEWRTAPLSVLLSAGIKFRFEKERFLCNPAPAGVARDCPVQFGTELPAAVGVVFRPSGVGIDDGGMTSLYAEARTYLPLAPVGPFEREEPAGAFASTGVRLTVRDVSFYGGVELGLIDGVGNAPVRASLGVDFAPRDHDQDDDGIEDDRDQCRELPEDHDGYEDEDGCPEVDDDQDGVPDGQDACPRKPAPGTRDGCPGEVDEPAGTSAGCPDVPGPADVGCPGPAPAAPEPPQTAPPRPAPPGPPAAASVPAVDDPDGDTYVGAEDDCPAEAETFDGDDDDDGCPEPGPPRKPLVEITDGTTLTANGMLAFDKDDAVERGSLPLLRAIAAELKKAPTARVLVGARPSPARKDQAKKRSFAVAQALRSYAGREDAAEVVDWDRVKGAPRAELFGIGLVLDR